MCCCNSGLFGGFGRRCGCGFGGFGRCCGCRRDCCCDRDRDRRCVTICCPEERREERRCVCELKCREERDRDCDRDRDRDCDKGRDNGKCGCFCFDGK